jgi:hypothetical protein
MPFEVTEENASALEPLFKPWEEPVLHRLPNPTPGGPAIVQPGRRPSKCPLVRSIRAEVDGWRRGGYAGVSETSCILMNFWFNTEHTITDEDGDNILFHYHWAQREAIETIIYLYELRNVRSVAELMFEFGNDEIADLALGINPNEDRWSRNCCKIATGGGKTKVMSLAIVWSYYNSLYESESDLARHFVPDFLVRVKNGGYLLCELKGRQDVLVPMKVRAAVEWCKAASKGQSKWQYLYVPYHLFQQSAVGTIAELTRACEPSLKPLLQEAETNQMELPLLEATRQKQSEDLFISTLREAGIDQSPAPIEDAMRQAVLLLDHAVRSRMPGYGHAFQPLLHPLDGYALRIIDKQLEPLLPANVQEREYYFSPELGTLSQREKALLEKYERYLRDNLVFGRSIMRLGTLLFCLSYAKEGGWGVSGVWKDVQKTFAGTEMAELYSDLEEVNSFRNTRVAHVETRLSDEDEAWKAMKLWLRCLKQMVDAAS